MAEFLLDILEEKPSTFWVSFTAQRPVGRDFQPYSGSIEVEEITQSELDAIGDDDSDDVDLLLSKTKNWKGSAFERADEGGKPKLAEFDQDLYERLLDHVWLKSAIVDAIFARMRGGKKGPGKRKVKN